MQPMGYGGGPAPMQMQMQMQGSGASYEFSELENATIASTARFARLWGVISLVSGVLVLVMGIGITALFLVMEPVAAASSSSSSSTPLKPAMIVAIGVSLIPSALVSIIGGLFYLSSGASLRRVVETQGEDIPRLMEAIRSLSRAFMIEAIAMIVSFVLGFGIGIAMQVGGHS